MVIPITHQSPIRSHYITFLGSNFDYYISNKYSFSIITVVQSASQSILTYVSEKYCLQSIIQGAEILYLMQISVLDANFCTWRQSLSSRCLAAKKDKDLIETVK